MTGSARPGISSFVPARTSYSRLRIGIALSLMKKDRPRATHRPASVAMNGWTLRYVMKKPIVAPNAMPMSSIRAITSHGSMPLPRRRAAEATVVRATTPPTDRSIPPDTMTKVIPMALMSRNGIARSMLRKTCGSRIAS